MYRFVDFLSNYVESKKIHLYIVSDMYCTFFRCLPSLCMDISRHFDCSILMLSYQTFMPVCLSPEENFYFFFFTIARID